MDVFFNGLKPKFADANVYGEYDNDVKKIEISCSFDFNPNEEIALDSSENTTTTLNNEYLVNKDGLLEISRIYECGKTIKTITGLIAKHPTNFTKPLITLKHSDLKKLAKELSVDMENVDERTKKEIRCAIFQQTSLDFNDEFSIETDAKESDILDLFKKFDDKLPLYMPFRADRTNTDKDKEVNDTTKAITKAVIAELESYFTRIKEEINDKIKELANKTLEKLKTFDKNITNELTPNIDAKALDSLFSFTFDCDDGISFNKRGSGIKRLMLLSFFLADAERKNDSTKTIIYAIEEPETSQHPDFQIMLMNSLKSLAESDNRQIILTTHTPEIVKIINKENLIFIQKDEGHSVSAQQGNNIEIEKVKDTLGILPFVYYKGVIFVEGFTDIKFLKNLSSIDQFKNIIDIRQFTFIPLNGCGNLGTWIKEDYLRTSNVKCLYFKDRDDNAEPTIPQTNNVIRTAKREIENYIPVDIVEQYFNTTFTTEQKQDWGNIDVAGILSQKVSRKEAEIKNILESAEIWRQITSFSQIDATEITEWFNKMNTFFTD